MGEAFDYSEFVTLAREMIEEFGRTIRLEKLGQPTPESFLFPDNDQSGRNVSDMVNTHGLFVDESASNIEFEQTFTNLVERDAHGFYVAAIEGKSLEGWNTLFDGSTCWQINKIKILKPGNIEILAFMEVAT